MFSLLLAFIAFGRGLKRNLYDPQFKVLLILVAGLLLMGTIFYSNVEGWSPLDSLYFSVVTLATVGYGDLVPKTDLGKIFTIFYIIIGIGILVNFATMLARRPQKAKPKPKPKR